MLRFASSVLLLLMINQSHARRASLQGRQLIVDGKPFRVRGICYSPTPINESVYFAPYGDYFTPEYSFIWLRDLPLIKAMGVNVVRTYGWQPANDHTQFLDALASHGLYGMTTFYMGAEEESPVKTEEERTKIIDSFVGEVAKYAAHPALLFWSFGNELNGVWNGYLKALGQDPDQPSCNWDDRYDDLGGCWIHTGTTPQPGDRCYEPSYCVYSRLFKFIGQAAEAAKEVADVLVVSAFADVDALYDKVGRAGRFASSLDAWTAQVYRGNTFGDFFLRMGQSADKPVLLTEYGVDAYHDECGSGEHTPCYNTLGDSSDSYVDEISQSEYALHLTLEIDAAASDQHHCNENHGLTGDGNCSGIGGFLMSWADEYWKGAKSQAACDPPQPSPKFNPKKCDTKAHVTCGNWDAGDHDLCGYWLDAAPDHYVNEEWFGINSPTICAGTIDALEPRATYWAMRKHWTGMGRDSRLFETCEEIVHSRCVVLGNGGGGSEPWLTRLLTPILRRVARLSAPTPSSTGGSSHGSMSESNSHGSSSGSVSGSSGSSGGERPAVCSGHGSCTTDVKECGPGNYNLSATPCCSCELGFAGVGCAELDVRVYTALGISGVLVALMVAMALTSIVSALTAGRFRGELTERLLHK